MRARTPAKRLVQSPHRPLSFVAALAMAGLFVCAGPPLQSTGSAAAKPPCKTPISAQDIVWKGVEKGIRYGTLVRPKARGVKPLTAHLLSVELGSASRGLTLRSLRRGRRSGRVEDVVSHYRARGVDVRAAINGDYFSFVGKGQVPFGLYLSAGQLLRSPSKSSSLVVSGRNRAAIGTYKLRGTVESKAGTVRIAAVGRRTEDGAPMLFHGTLAARLPGGKACDIVRFVERVQGSMVKAPLRLTVGPVAKSRALKPGELGLMACKQHRAAMAALTPGTRVTLSVALEGASVAPVEALSGGPRVLRAGKVVNEMTAEGFSATQRFYLPLRHPRTAVGVTSKGDRALLLVAEGRSDRSAGLTAAEAGCVLKAAGASDAMLLDGGGSAAMFVGERFVNKPMSKRNRSSRGVANVLAVVRAGKGKR